MEPNVDRGMWSVIVLLLAVGMGVGLTVLFPKVSGYVQDTVETFKDEADKKTVNGGYEMPDKDTEDGVGSLPNEGIEDNVSNNKPYIALEYDISKGLIEVPISNEDLRKDDIYVYKGDYLSNKSKIDSGFKDPDFTIKYSRSDGNIGTELTGMGESLSGVYTVISTNFINQFY